MSSSTAYHYWVNVTIESNHFVGGGREGWFDSEWERKDLLLVGGEERVNCWWVGSRGPIVCGWGRRGSIVRGVEGQLLVGGGGHGQLLVGGKERANYWWVREERVNCWWVVRRGQIVGGWGGEGQLLMGKGGEGQHICYPNILTWILYSIFFIRIFKVWKVVGCMFVGIVTMDYSGDSTYR